MIIKRKGWGDVALGAGVLLSIREQHLLKRCPGCGTPISRPRMTEPVPPEGTPGCGGGYYLESTQSQTHTCRACNLVWTLSIRNLTYRRHANDTRTHTLRLVARRPHVCECPSCITQTDLLFDDEVHGCCHEHGTLGLRCDTLSTEGASAS